MCYLIRCTIAYSSLRSFVSQSCAHSACFASSVRSATTVPFCCVFLFFLFTVSSPTDVRSLELSTIEVMYLSFRRSRDALLALGFFVLMVVIVFSTLLYVQCASSSHHVGLTHHICVQLFYRAWYMGRHPRSLHQLRWRSIAICGWSSFIRSFPCTSF
jgi:hypothetical protein